MELNARYATCVVDISVLSDDMLAWCTQRRITCTYSTIANLIKAQ